MALPFEKTTNHEFSPSQTESTRIQCESGSPLSEARPVHKSDDLEPASTTTVPDNSRDYSSGADCRDHAAHDRLATDVNDASDDEMIDAEFAGLVESITRRIQAGEAVDAESLVADYPDWAGTLRKVLPALYELAHAAKAVEVAGNVLRPLVDTSPFNHEFGEFRIIREVGRGGAGIVYEAEQIALGRTVALKVLAWAATRDARAVERFELEARVVALLQHPRIIPIYDVGQLDQVPFYAMQFVEGGSLADVLASLRAPQENTRPATSKNEAPTENELENVAQPGSRSGTCGAVRHSDRCGIAALLPNGRTARSVEDGEYIQSVVRLGIQAAEALDYAHGQGIVHRDIKPANLLLDHGGGLWVADFGMADVQGDAGLTLTGDLPGTLRYMSPEQALGKRALVDGRTDIYSLGATMYELLTLRPAVEGSDRGEILRRIRDGEPTPLRRLNRAVPVDLETIIAKSLAKEPAGRYETAGQLADDLTRFLEGRPIAARPVSALARSWRWCKRNPIPAGLAAALFLFLIVGFAGSMWSWRESVRQQRLLHVAEQEARQQAAIAQSINRFLIDKVLGQASPENNPAANRLTLLEVLDRAATDVSSSFRGQQQTEAAIRLTIGRAYHGLGEYVRSESHLRPAYQIALRETGELGHETLEAKAALGHTLVHLGRIDEAEGLLEQAAEDSRRVFGRHDSATLASSESYAGLLESRGRYADAEALYRRYLADAREVLAPDDEIILSGMNNLALVVSRRGHNDEAETLIRQVIDDSRQWRGPHHPGTLSAMNNLAMLMERQRRFHEAEMLFRECLKTNREILGPQHPHTCVTAHNLAKVLQDLNKLEEAESLFRQTLDSQREVMGRENPATLFTAVGLASVLHDRGRDGEAEPLLRESLELQHRILGASHPDARRSARVLDAIVKRRTVSNSETARTSISASDH
jgi:serine/threonine protein kinase